MAHADLFTHFWGEALSIAAYVLNRLETKAKPFTPDKICTRQKLNLSNAYLSQIMTSFKTCESWYLVLIVYCHIF